MGNLEELRRKINTLSDTYSNPSVEQQVQLMKSSFRDLETLISLNTLLEAAIRGKISGNDMKTMIPLLREIRTTAKEACDKVNLLEIRSNRRSHKVDEAIKRAIDKLKAEDLPLLLEALKQLS